MSQRNNTCTFNEVAVVFKVSQGQFSVMDPEGVPLNSPPCPHFKISYEDYVCLVALRPKSTAMVIAGRSVHLATLFPGQA